MAKSINVSGRMSVERFNGEFQKAFGVRCNVKISKWVNADGKATLASIRPKDFKGPSKVDLSIVGNMTVGTLKKRFEENFGVMIELYIGRKIAPDDVTIGAIREGRAKASKGEKPTETAPKTPKPDKPDSAQKPSGSNLTEEQIKEYKERLENAEDGYEYQDIAEDIGYDGDKKWAKEIFKKAEPIFEDSSDFYYMAEKVTDSDYLGDREYALELYKRAEDLATDFDEIRNVAESVAREFGDKDYALELYKKAEDKCSDDVNYFLSLAGSVCEYLEDKDYGREIFKKAENLLSDPTDFVEAAILSAGETYLNDKDHAIKLLNKAESDSSDNPKNLSLIGTTYVYHINDKDKAKEIFEKCEALIDSLDEEDFMIKKYIYLADDVNNENGFNDRDYAKKLYMKAENLIASGGWDASELAGYLEDFDKEWSKNVKKGNYGTQG